MSTWLIVLIAVVATSVTFAALMFWSMRRGIDVAVPLRVEATIERGRHNIAVQLLLEKPIQIFIGSIAIERPLVESLGIQPPPGFSVAAAERLDLHDGEPDPRAAHDATRVSDEAYEAFEDAQYEEAVRAGAEFDIDYVRFAGRLIVDRSRTIVLPTLRSATDHASGHLLVTYVVRTGLLQTTRGFTTDLRVTDPRPG